ncbi:MAG: hypothetical protein IJT44_13465 [Clostridia bacterium]|nr:hypothetical protein [Clostridia bacterium]
MKACKKYLAVLLSVLMILSVAAVPASAEDAEKASLRIVSVTATKFAENDSQTVLQMELVIACADASVQFDTLNNPSEITVCEGFYAYVSYGIATVRGELENSLPKEEYDAKSEEILKSAAVATLRPVAFTDGVLLADVYSTDGTPGAKIVSFQTSSYTQAINAFALLIPEGLLKDSASGTISKRTHAAVSVTGDLAERMLNMPLVVVMVLGAVTSGNYKSLLRFLPLLPILIFVLPPLFINSISNAERILSDVYGLDYKGLVHNALRATPQLLKYFLTNLF